MLAPAHGECAWRLDWKVWYHLAHHDKHWKQSVDIELETCVAGIPFAYKALNISKGEHKSEVKQSKHTSDSLFMHIMLIGSKWKNPFDETISDFFIPFVDSTQQSLMSAW